MKHLPWALILTILISIDSFASWKNDLSLILKESNVFSYETKKTINRIEKANPSWNEVTNHIKNQTFKVTETGIIEKRIIGVDGRVRPYVIYVPIDYNPSIKTPAFVYLHGAVRRSTISQTPVESAKKRRLLKICKQNGWIMIFPYAEAQSMWWIKTGHINVLEIIKEVKGIYNIDDDKVYLSGFSDGASGSFYFSMVDPTNFAAFIPLNGHMGVGGLGGAQLYPSNMKNTPLYVINTDLDPLYPAREMVKLIDLARSADANIFYKEYFGYKHEETYIDFELDDFSTFLKNNPRKSHPHHLEWKSAKERFGNIKWLTINSAKRDTEKEEWHKEYNLSSIDNTVSLGFIPDYDFESVGVRVDSLPDGDTLARRLGLKKYDVIIKLNESVISNIEDLDNFYKTVHRGDTVNATIKRKNNNVELEANIPEAVTYQIFNRDKKEGAIIADFKANTFIIKASRVRAFSIFIHPHMVQLDQPVTIIVDGVEQYKKIIIPDIGFLVRNYIKNKDRSLIYIKRIDIVI